MHLIDRTNSRLLTIDTDTGDALASIGLAGTPDVGALMSISPDGRTLCVPLSSSSKLQFVSLSNLVTEDILSTGVAPGCTAAGSDGQLYVVSQGTLYKVDPTTGQAISTGRQFYAPLLKANATGTKLYVMELGLSGGGETIEEFAVVPGGMPSRVKGHGPGKANDKDFEVNETDGLIYATAGGVYGINTIDAKTGSTRFWSYDSPYGVATAYFPGGEFVYGASGDSFSPRIRRFDRVTGSVSATFDIVQVGNKHIADRSLQVTPNGNIFFGLGDFGVGSDQLGLIGTSNLMPSIPPASIAVDLGLSRTVDVGSPLVLKANGATAMGTVAWAKRSGPGRVVFTPKTSASADAVFSVPGSYVVEVAYTENGKVSRDLLAVHVQQAPQPILSESARVRWRVPLGTGDMADGGNPWYANAFDDSNWQVGETGVGYETRLEGFYDLLIKTSIPSELRGKTRTTLLRVPFRLAAPPSQVKNLELRMRFDDGFVAYLNSHPVARANAPENEIGFDAGATASQTTAQALATQTFDLTPHLSLLHEGDNLLAIQGLNFVTNDSAFLCVPEIYAVLELTPFEAWLGGYDGISGDSRYPDADADHDGRSNWLEFSTGGHPGHVETPAELQLLQIRGETFSTDTGTHLEVTYLRRDDPAAAGLSYRLLFAYGLEPGAWRLAGSPQFPATELSSQPGPVEGMVTVRVRLDLPLVPQRPMIFTRLLYE